MPFVSGSLLFGLNMVVAVLSGCMCVIATLRGRLSSVVYIVCKIEPFDSITLNEDFNCCCYLSHYEIAKIILI